MPETKPDPRPLDTLLDLARAAVVAAVAAARRRSPTPGPTRRSRRAADAFVTLTEDGDLRGCIGTLGAELPVGAAVVHAAEMAATRDPRFRPVARAELARPADRGQRARPAATPGRRQPPSSPAATGS